jgi:hypothetical protein
MPNNVTELIMEHPYEWPKELLQSPLDANIYLGIPLWAGIFTILGIVVVCVIIFWGLRARSISFIRGYGDASRDPSLVCTGIFTGAGGLQFTALKMIDRIITRPLDDDRLDCWHHAAVANASIGKQPVVFVSPMSDVSKDPVSEIAVCKIVETFNEGSIDSAGNPVWVTMVDRRTGKSVPYIAENGLPKQRCIRNFEDFIFFKNELMATYPDGIPIDPVNEYDPIKVHALLDRGSSSAQQGGIRMTSAEELRLEADKDDFLGTYGKIIIVGVICIALLIVEYIAVKG